MLLREFVCDDCGATVFAYNDGEQRTTCRVCLEIQGLKAREPMTAEQEATLREILGCVQVARRLPPARKPGASSIPPAG